MPVVVLILIDGLRPDALATGRCPHIDGLRASGSAQLQASSTMPSVTLPCHASVFFSVPPSRHGITTNVWMPMARPLPGLMEVAHAAGNRCAFIFNWEELRDLSSPGSLDFSYFRDNNSDPDGDQHIADEAVRYFSDGGTDFAFVYLGALDSYGHKYGWMTDGYLEQLERTDAAVGTLLDALSAEATILLLSDHGGHERIHGTEAAEDMVIPWIIAGPGIRRGHKIQRPVNLIDTAPTIARVLGITPHPEWEGQCVDEVFDQGDRDESST